MGSKHPQKLCCSFCWSSLWYDGKVQSPGLQGGNHPHSQVRVLLWVSNPWSLRQREARLRQSTAILQALETVSVPATAGQARDCLYHFNSQTPTELIVSSCWRIRGLASGTKSIQISQIKT